MAYDEGTLYVQRNIAISESLEFFFFLRLTSLWNAQNTSDLYKGGSGACLSTPHILQFDEQEIYVKLVREIAKRSADAIENAA